MAHGREAPQRTNLTRALELSAYISLAFLIAISCFLILRPFIPLIAWGVIIAVASCPGFRKLERLLGGRAGLAAVVFTLVFLMVFILPTVWLAQSAFQGIHTVTIAIKDGTPLVPPPPSTIASWPIVGPSLSGVWTMASRDLSQAISKFAPQIIAVLPGLLSASAGVGLTALQLFLAILVSGALLANSKAAAAVTTSLFNRIFAEQGPEFQQLVGSTIRSVTFGILGVAVIQSVFAVAGFLVVGLPGASLWSLIFLFAAVLQMGGLVLVPAVIYEFAIASTTKAVIFLIWCIIVGVMDNFLKPLLLGRGAAVPVVVVFLGAIGGFMVMNVIGLFVGAIVLSVGYKLFLAWLNDVPSIETNA